MERARDELLAGPRSRPRAAPSSSAAATFATCRSTPCIASDAPTIASGRYSAASSVRSRRFSRASRSRSSALRRTSTDLVRLERLREEVVGARLHRLERRVVRAVRAHHDDGQLRLEPLDLAEQREPVHAGHPHVGEDEVVLARGELAQRVRSAPDRAGLPAVIRQDHGEQVAHGGLVVDDEDAAERHGGTLARTPGALRDRDRRARRKGRARSAAGGPRAPRRPSRSRRGCRRRAPRRSRGRWRARARSPAPPPSS